ncbi:unnamed protein product [Calicophoron daubneyi]
MLSPKSGLEMKLDSGSPRDIDHVDERIQAPKLFDMELFDTADTFQALESLFIPKVADYERTLTEIEHDHPAFPVRRCFTMIRSRKAAEMDIHGASLSAYSALWSSKYAPTTCSALLYNCSSLDKIQHWLERWKSQTKHSNSSSPRKKVRFGGQDHSERAYQLRDSDDDFVLEPPSGKRRKAADCSSICTKTVESDSLSGPKVPLGSVCGTGILSESESESDEIRGGLTSDEDDSQSESSGISRSDWRTKAYLLVGPTGTGKTSLVYALANDVGLKVFELNPSTRRSGRDLCSQFQVALDSHHVAKANLSKNFSTFNMTAKAKVDHDAQKSKAHRTVANFFEPRITAKAREKSRKTPRKPFEKVPKGLNLSCDSLILLDEVDVLFDSDRGFWSGLCSLLRLARRPIVLTASDPMLTSSLPVPAHVCHIRPPSPESIIPFLQLVSLAEGYELTTETVQSFYTSLSRWRNPLDQSLSANLGDIRWLLNELQWFVAPPFIGDQIPSGVIRRDWSQASQFQTSPLDWLSELCPRISSIRIQTKSRPIPKPVHEVKPSRTRFDPTDLGEVFDDEVDCSNPSSEQKLETLPSHEPVCTYSSPSILRCIGSVLTDWQLIANQACLFDTVHEGAVRASVCFTLSYLGCLQGPSQLSWPTESNGVLPLDPASSNRNGSDKSITTSSVNPVMANALAPLVPMNRLNEAICEYWPHILSSTSRSRLISLENELEENMQKERPTEVPESGDFSKLHHSVIHEDRALSRILSELGHAGGTVSRFALTSRKSLACDYLPCLRKIASGEAVRQTSSTKRRFLHYFDRTGIYLRNSTRQILSLPAFRLANN